LKLNLKEARIGSSQSLQTRLRQEVRLALEHAQQRLQAATIEGTPTIRILPGPLGLQMVQSTSHLCQVMKFLEREVRKSGSGQRLSYYHAHWTRAGAPLLDELGAVIDHVEAYCTGGASTEGNLATACATCNGRKSAAPMAKWSERPQRKPSKGKYGEPQYWDGLSSVLVILTERDPDGLTASEKEWLKILGRNPKRRGIVTLSLQSRDIPHYARDH
jgi:hypothetical protein